MTVNRHYNIILNLQHKRPINQEWINKLIDHGADINIPNHLGM